MEQFKRSRADVPEERRRPLGELLGTLGEGAVIRPPFYCDYAYQTQLGARSFANFGLVAVEISHLNSWLGPPEK